MKHAAALTLHVRLLCSLSSNHSAASPAPLINNTVSSLGNYPQCTAPPTAELPSIDAVTEEVDFSLMSSTKVLNTPEVFLFFLSPAVK